MDTLLIKIFATALTLSQATTAPDALKTHFDRSADQEQVVELLKAGCQHMRQVFDIENINIEDLLSVAMQDAGAIAGADNAVFRGLNFGDLNNAYRQFCTNEKVGEWGLDLGAVIDFYNQTLADLPDDQRLRDYRKSATAVLDGKGRYLADIFDTPQRRIWAPLGEIPLLVQRGFIAAEDKRFYEHHGIDERGLIRAFIANMGQTSRPQGGSTITQQVVKNLLVGDEVSYERKMRELVLTVQMEHDFSKDEILELYLNSIYLGRNSWGVEMAARSYFGKSANALTLPEGALLAALAKGPTYFSPTRHPDRLHERLDYVLGRMQEDGVITQGDAAQARAQMPTLLAGGKPPRNFGFYYLDQVARELKSVAPIGTPASAAYTVHSTIDPQLQESLEAALQEGLARYEQSAERVQFQGPEANLSGAVRGLEAQGAGSDKRPAWQRALINARLPLYDVHWRSAIVLDASGRRSGPRIGLADGRILPLSVERATAGRSLKPYDVVLVQLTQGKGRSARAELRVRPQVQGAALVLENKTGRILAMTGGFSYALSELNRVTQAQRQPGSALKPLSYLAALEKGLQPDTLIRDEPITFAPMNGKREEDYWSPKNYEGRSSGVITLRQALEDSRNLATAHLLEGGIEASPQQSLDRLCALAQEMRIYRDCTHFYPFILGAQPVRPIDLAAFYAAIANEGARPTPHVIDSIEQDGRVIYRQQGDPPADIPPAQRAAFYQLKNMMQGVLLRGTARALSPLAPYVAGKTGTTEDENDAWFVGFTNEVTVAVWVGYDNASSKRTLGDGATGAQVAAPIFEQIIQAVWSEAEPKTALAPPSPAAARKLSCGSNGTEGRHRTRVRSEDECLLLDDRGRPVDARYALVHEGGGSRNALAHEGGASRNALAHEGPSRRTYARDQNEAGQGWSWNAYDYYDNGRRAGNAWGRWQQPYQEPQRSFFWGGSR